MSRSSGRIRKQKWTSGRPRLCIARDVEVLRNLNVPYEALDRRGCIKVEPALAEAPAEFVGGLRLPDDETGDCRLFTERLAAMAEVLGVTFSHSMELLSLVTDSRAVTSAATSRGADS
ncbi:FAD-dependent oxidoreductase [Aquibium pacificus]|uniref:FAD-dependent oxidoreductase n=1 Tax=Aquibium pacificus TaxID=3153579 RepID=UPI00349F9AE3